MRVSDTIVDTPPLSETRAEANLEKLKTYVLKILPIQKEIQDLQRKTGKFLSANKSISEIESEIKRIIGVYQDKVKERITRDVEALQTRKNTKADSVLVALQEWESLQGLEKYLYLIKGTGVSDIISKQDRESNIARINGAVNRRQEELKKFYPYGSTWFFEDVAKYFSRWTAMAPYFSNPVNADGKYLYKTNPDDAELLKIYEVAKLGEIVKFQYYKPFFVWEKEYQEKINGKIVNLHPGFGFPGLNQSKEGKSKAEVVKEKETFLKI